MDDFIIFETENLRFAMDKDGLEGTIEDKRDHPGYCVLESIEPQEVFSLYCWCEKVLKEFEKTYHEENDNMSEEDKEAYIMWKLKTLRSS